QVPEFPCGNEGIVGMRERGDEQEWTSIEVPSVIVNFLYRLVTDLFVVIDLQTPAAESCLQDGTKAHARRRIGLVLTGPVRCPAIVRWVDVRRDPFFEA